MNAQASPQNTDAEEAVLGAMLLDNKDVIDKVADFLEPSDFYKHSNGLIFAAAIELSKTSPVNPVFLAAELERTQQLSEIGGRERIKALALLVPMATQILHFAQLVKDTKGQRDLITAAGQISQKAWAGGSIDDNRAFAEETLQKAIVDHTKSSMEMLPSGLHTVIQEIRDVVGGAPPMTGLQTGFAGLDKITTGLHPGQLTVIAGRTSMGKSVLAQNILENIATEGKIGCLFSLEMQKREIQLRSLARQGQIPLNRLRTGQLLQQDLPRLTSAQALMEPWQLFLMTNTSLTPPELHAHVKRLWMDSGLDLLVVDYLQLMTTDEDADNRTLELSSITRSLKNLAISLHIPVIIVSQLNRGVDNRAKGSRRPELADLRDSGAIEQDADVVIFIYREEYYDPETPDKGIAELIVRKNRMGATETVRMTFTGAYQDFKTIGAQI